MKKAMYLILTILWMAVIFIFSNQGADDSSKLSNSFIDNTIIKVYRLFDREKSKEKIINTYSYPVRKLAHFTIYLILGILVYNLLKLYNINKLYIGVLLCMIYACTDEFHQVFVIGRSCELKDVLIDTFGSFIGILVLNKIRDDKYY